MNIENLVDERRNIVKIDRYNLPTILLILAMINLLIAIIIFSL